MFDTCLYIVAGVGLFNVFIWKRKELQLRMVTKRMSFIPYIPQMFTDDGRELKYAGLVRHGETYLVSIVTDGMHQIVPIRRYFGIRSKARGQRATAYLDDHIRITDIAHGFYWILRTLFFLLS